MILNNEILTYFCCLLKIFFVPARTFLNFKPMNFCSFLLVKGEQIKNYIFTKNYVFLFLY